jgi:hypothetical protein
VLKSFPESSSVLIVLHFIINTFFEVFFQVICKNAFFDVVSKILCFFAPFDILVAQRIQKHRAVDIDAFANFVVLCGKSGVYDWM